MALFGQALIGVLTTAILFALSFAMAVSPMAGPPDYTIMFFFAAPAALIARFLGRRQRGRRRLIGSAVFSLPILCLCAWMFYCLNAGHKPAYASLAGQWLGIGLLSLVAQFVSSFAFNADP
jgi:hypothetical protein